MPYYVVNRNAQFDSGDHEVHIVGCGEIKNSDNLKDLGFHMNCSEAVKEAKLYYSDSNGCYYCCRECHTT